MAYSLGIDLGTSFTAAALVRWGPLEVDKAEPVALGSSSSVVPTVVHLADDGAVIVGEAAQRRGADSPDHVVAEFKRRVGDDVPLVVGDAAVSAHDLLALVVRWVVDVVDAREGAAADVVVLTHPASWGAHRTGLVRDALEAVGLPDVELLPEPSAAALHYAARERFAPETTVAVYDLGGGTFDAAVVRSRADGHPELLGVPGGLEDLGGADVDDAVLAHVLASLPPEAMTLDPADPHVATALARLRRECVEAKEALSADTEATIPVLLPGVSTRVRLLRSELEAMITEPLERTVEVMRSTLVDAGLGAGDLDRVLLVGGSSRIPLVAELLSRELGRPVSVDADPKLTTALGAAAAGARAALARSAPGPAPAEEAVQLPGAPSRVGASRQPLPAAAWTTTSGLPALAPRPALRSRSVVLRRTRWALAASAAGILLVAVAARATSDTSNHPLEAAGQNTPASAAPSGSPASAPAPASKSGLPQAQIQALVADRVSPDTSVSARRSQALIVLTSGTPTSGVGVLATTSDPAALTVAQPPLASPRASAAPLAPPTSASTTASPPSPTSAVTAPAGGIATRTPTPASPTPSATHASTAPATTPSPTSVSTPSPTSAASTPPPATQNPSAASPTAVPTAAAGGAGAQVTPDPSAMASDTA